MKTLILINILLTISAVFLCTGINNSDKITKKYPLQLPIPEFVFICALFPCFNAVVVAICLIILTHYSIDCIQEYIKESNIKTINKDFNQDSDY